jgi:D-alanine--poly(phosphoribitol) ligase subunit 1
MKFSFDTFSFTETDILPEKLAIAGSDEDLSWNEFRIRTEKLSRVFLNLGASAATPVVIYGHKEASFPVAIMAAVLAGVPYIPVDKSFPAGRIESIRRTSGAEIIFCCNDDVAPEGFVHVVRSEFHSAVIERYSGGNHSADNTCYIMFTSGSTGEPKGVMIPRSAVRSFVNWMHNDYPIDDSTVFMNQAAFTFDISLIDIYGAMSLGATAVLMTTEIGKNPSLLFERIKKYQCTFWNSTPSFVMISLMHPDFKAESLSSLRDFILLGEILTARVVTGILDAFPMSRVYNAYGPTEATVATTIINVTREVVKQSGAQMPIGYAKNGNSISILNESGNESDEGEIIITGQHVGTGYLARPELSSEKFFINYGERAYRTGDFGFIKNNIVYFNGRKDDQIKLHGYRIEISEINDVILRHPSVKESATLPFKVGGVTKRIVAFVVKKDASEKSDILKWAGLYLPSYMVPADLCFVDELPVNINHKVDAAALMKLYSEQ